jgi:hypothetical protein
MAIGAVRSRARQRVLPAGDPAVAYRHATRGAVPARLANLGRVRLSARSRTVAADEPGPHHQQP